MKLETVRGVSVGDMRLEIRWQIDNVDCAEWAFLGTDTTSNAKALGDEGDLRVRGDLNTELSTSYNWARFLAFLSAFL